MADEPQVIRSIDWRSALPFTLIFRSFRIAIHPSKLFLALVALIMIYLGGRVLDGAWRVLVPAYRATPSEMQIFEASRSQDNPYQYFHDRRNAEREQLGKQNKMMLEAIGKSDGGTDDLVWRIKHERDKEIDRIHRQFSTDTSPDARKRRNAALRATYSDAATAIAEAEAADGFGLFDTFFNYELSQINVLLRGLRTANWFGETGASESLVRMFVWAPMWALQRHPIFFALFGIYFLAIWSIFGGAIARVAAVHVARDEKISIRQALAFSMGKFLSFVSAPIIPLVIVMVVGLVVTIGGVLGNIPGIGPILVGALFFLALAAGFVMALVLLGTAGGFNLMYPTIAVEGSDSFDAISRSFSYLYARPWRLVFYTLVAFVYGSVCYLFVRFFVYLMLSVAHLFVALGFRYRADDSAMLWQTMWPEPISSTRLLYAPDYATLTTMQSFGAWLLSIWIYLTIAMLGAFAISFYFSTNTVIYFLMRNEVDATELDDVFLEQGEEEFGETMTTETAVATSTTEDSGEGKSESPSEKPDES